MNNINNPLTFNHRAPKLQNQDRKHRNYANLKPTYQAMNWKNYTINRPRNISLQDVDRLSNKNSVRHHHSPSYYQPQTFQPINGLSNISQNNYPNNYQNPNYINPNNPMGQNNYLNASNNMSSLSQKKLIRQQNLRLSGITYSNKRQQHVTRVKQDAIRRVKMLQDKVLPLIKNDGKLQDQNEQYGFGWQLKMQQKLIKIQNSIQKIKNQIQIKYQKRLIQIQKLWQQRINDLLYMLNENQSKNNIPSSQQEVIRNQNQLINNQQINGIGNPFIVNNEQRQINSRNQYVYYRSGFQQQPQINGNDTINGYSNK